MYYEINVSCNGSHFFATAPRSITSVGHLKWLHRAFKEKFKVEDGYEITVYRCEQTGKQIDPDSL